VTAVDSGKRASKVSMAKAMAVVVALLLASSSSAVMAHDYGDALQKSILFFEGQRSGRLPPNQRLRWRQDSGLHDGAEAGVRTTVVFFL
jgi:hypothetical protein